MEHSYKCLHEEFLTNLTGSNPVEIVAVISCAPLSVLLRTLLSLLFFSNNSDKKNVKSISIQFLLDFSTLVVPAVLCLTVLADYLALTMSTLLCVASGLLVLVQNHNNPYKPNNSTDDNCKLSYLTFYRALIYLMTAVCILAVDFDIFPRRYAKTEAFGFSVMDAGVGSFILVNAIICHEARQIVDDRSWQDKKSNVVYAVKSSCPLLILGFLRLFTVKSIDYQEHISEYGVHWNFFFTLAIIKIFSSFFFVIIPSSMCGLLSFFIIGSYQFSLSFLDMEHFILMGSEHHGSRNGFLNANREGILSSLGYLSLFFMGVELGRYIFKSRSEKKSSVTLIWELCAVDAIFFFLAFFSHTYIEHASRRILNMAYYAWAIAINICLIIGFITVELISVSVVHISWTNKSRNTTKTFEGIDDIPLESEIVSTTSSASSSFCLLEGINKHGLFFFLLANILTGLVNIFLETIHVSSSIAILILILYMLALCIAVMLLQVKEVTTKFW